jgi:hypothetical protein
LRLWENFPVLLVGPAIYSANKVACASNLTKRGRKNWEIRRLLGNLFELEDLGTKDLKGIGAPGGAWAPLRGSSVESRFEALHAIRLTVLVGREEEIELLLRRWSRAKTGEGQVVLLSAEADIGKSRLTVALMERIADEPHTRLRYFCSPQTTCVCCNNVLQDYIKPRSLEHEPARFSLCHCCGPVSLGQSGCICAACPSGITRGGCDWCEPRGQPASPLCCRFWSKPSGYLAGRRRLRGQEIH